jgi:RNA polymerase sigma-70 factor (ECF subfamily)
MSADLQAAYQAGRAAFPGVELAEARYAEFVRERLGAALPEAPIAADLFLACACIDGDRRALEAFDAGYLALVPQFVARLEASAAGIDELRQRLREKLFVGVAGGPPKIAEYTGRGRLQSWLRVVAIRSALNEKASHKPESPASDLDERLATADPELDYLRQRYRGEFRDAFAAAFAKLEPRDRTMLRLHLVDGLGIDRLAPMYGVHRATAARWLASVRESLFVGTRDALRARLGVSATEFASLVRLVRSELDLSIRRLLDEAGDDASHAG